MVLKCTNHSRTVVEDFDWLHDLLWLAASECHPTCTSATGGFSSCKGACTQPSAPKVQSKFVCRGICIPKRHDRQLFANSQHGFLGSRSPSAVMPDLNGEFKAAGHFNGVADAAVCAGASKAAVRPRPPSPPVPQLAPKPTGLQIDAVAIRRAQQTLQQRSNTNAVPTVQAGALPSLRKIVGSRRGGAPLSSSTKSVKRLELKTEAELEIAASSSEELFLRAVLDWDVGEVLEPCVPLRSRPVCFKCPFSA
jgi:hypothetical protein